MLDKTYDAAAIEPRIAEKWENNNAFRAGAGAKPGAETFSIVIPPPNVTGSLHMGHALNNTLQDILVRFERMRGKDVLWQPGTDHAGIATQMVVERQLAQTGEDRRDMGREAFVRRVWEWKEQSGGTIGQQLRRLGASCDWSRERFTMGDPANPDDQMVEAVTKAFVTLYEQGLIYRDKRLVNWDPHFQTSISDLEVENREVDGHMWHFKYPLAPDAETGEPTTYEYIERDEEGNELFRETRDYISIATTRPETMLGDGAVAVHPSDERYAPIIGKLCEIPVGPKEHRRLIPIITDEYPDKDFGSGAVKITGAHDFNDYAVARRNNIPMYRLMATDGSMRDDGAPYVEAVALAMQVLAQGGTPDANHVDTINLVPDEYRGLDRFKAREKVVADITAEGLAIMVPETDPRLGPVKPPLAPEEGGEVRALVPLVEAKPIMQPFGDRSNVVIEPMLTDQWFCDAETLAKPAIAAVREGRTQFVPRQWENTYFHWMENIQPWCISRQLWWGHQIPAWYGPDGAIYVASSAAQAQAKAGAGVKLTRDEDVLDTWFSSGLWPFSTLGWPENTQELQKYYPTSVVSTAFDIIFFWVARMMMMGLHFTGEEPFRTVYMHPLVRDKNGDKMSKSKGNGIDPLDLIDEVGADALRFTLASLAVQGRDVRLDPARVAGYRNFCTKIWNATRFAQMNEIAPQRGFQPSSAKSTVNRWVISELAKATRDVTEALEKYRFNDAANHAYSFTWNTVCDWYLELLKPVFASDDEAAKAESRAVGGYIFDNIYTLLHPFMPFVTEELWAKTAQRDGLLCHAPWPAMEGGDVEAAAEINWLVALITQIRSVRSEMNVKPSLKTELVVVNADETIRQRLETHHVAIERMARVDSVSTADAVPAGSAQVLVDGTTFALPLKGIVDFQVETARLQKEKDSLEKEIRQLSGKLANEKFVANAPQNVVVENRERLHDAENKRLKVSEAMDRIQSLKE